MARWTVNFGGDEILIRRTPAGLWAINMPARREAIADRAAVEDLRRKLGAALADGSQETPPDTDASGE